MVRRLGAFVENRHGRPPGERIPRPRLLRPIWPEAALWIKLPLLEGKVSQQDLFE